MNWIQHYSEMAKNLKSSKDIARGNVLIHRFTAKDPPAEDNLETVVKATLSHLARIMSDEGKLLYHQLTIRPKFRQ